MNAGRRPRADPDADQLRLLAKVARMYHERGIRQPRIAAELNISQPRVSRLLKQASDIGVVRTVVVMPAGTHSDLEQRVQERYSLKDVVVVDTDGAGDDVLQALGAATADYLETSLVGGHTIGISSWSETLVCAVDLMHVKSTRATRVVQVVGGLGDPEVQMQATRLTARLADLTGATPVFLSAPGLVGSAATRRALIADPSVGDVTALWSSIDVALVGIGCLEPSPLLQRSGNALGADEQRELLSLARWATSACATSTPAALRSGPTSISDSSASPGTNCCGFRAEWELPGAAGSSPPSTPPSSGSGSTC